MTFISSARSRLPIAALLDDREGRVDQLGERAGALGEAQVGDHDEVLEVLRLEVVAQQVDRGQLVDGDVEEALDLALVEVHGQDPVGAGDGDHVGDQAGRDRDARLVLLVRPAVGVERHDGGDPAGAGPLEGVDHDQQLHDRLVDREQVGWIRNTSFSRTLSRILTKMFSLANSKTSALPSSTSR